MFQLKLYFRLKDVLQDFSLLTLGSSRSSYRTLYMKPLRLLPSSCQYNDS